MTHAAQAHLKLGWCGPEEQGLAWLCQRLRERVELTQLPALTELSLNEVKAQAITFDRLIVACPERVALAWQPLQSLQCGLPELPIAVATSDWWNGASRTGLQQRQAVFLPWYRWLDGWLPWLTGSPAAFFEPLPHRLPYALNSATWLGSTDGSALRPARFHPDGHVSGPRDAGLIVAGSYEMAQAWLSAALACGQTACWIRPDRFEAALAESGVPLWLLWDDSCCDTTPARTMHCGGQEFFQRAAAVCPGTLKLAALTMPRWDAWRDLELCGVDELLAKPTTPAALAWSLLDRQLRSSGEQALNREASSP